MSAVKKLTIFEMLAALVSRSSVSSKDPALDQSNRSVISILTEWLEQLDFTVILIPSDGLPEKLNLIASFGDGEGGLVLSGHSDTVPFDEKQWTSDPLKLRKWQNRWYGLGTTDMKCFFPLIIESIRRIDYKKVKKPITIVATADEESTMSGIRKLQSMKRPIADYAVIGEPTAIKPIRMNKGIMMESIKVSGLSGHSSNPEKGKNAIDGIWKIMKGLMEWREALKELYVNPSFEVNYPTVNFGRISGGDSPNRICPFCELQIDIRLLPGMDISTVRHSIQKKALEMLEDTGLTVEITPLFHGTPAMETSKNSLIVKEAEKVSGLQAGAVQYGTEGYYLNAMGMETILFGPGNISVAHQPDEYLETTNIAPAVDFYTALIKKFCF